METWKPVRGYEGLYEVSDLGNVMRTAKYLNSKDTPIRTSMRGKYLALSLCRDNKKKTHLVHRLVCDAFIGIPAGLVVNHKNGDKTDNRLVNLEVVTRKENEAHKWDVLKTGARNGAKLTSAQVAEIRELRKQGLTLKAIAARYGVAFTTIHWIVSGGTWKRNVA